MGIFTEINYKIIKYVKLVILYLLHLHTSYRHTLDCYNYVVVALGDIGFVHSPLKFANKFKNM